MTITMGSPSPAPAEPPKAHAKEKQGAGSKDTAGKGGGFEAILSSLGQEQDSDLSADASAKPDAQGVDVISSDAPATQAVEPTSEIPTDPALLLANLALSVPPNGGGAEGAEVNGDALGAAGPKKPGKGLLVSEKMTTDGTIGKADRAKEKLLDGLHGVPDGAELPKEITPGDSKASKDQKAHQSQSLLAATAEAKGKDKEFQAEQIQSKAAVLLDMANPKDANTELANRPQEPLAAKSAFAENVGSGLQNQTQPAISYQSTNDLMGSMLPVDGVAGQQVNYWISSDVKNAEMKLDGLGKGPVEVSISVHGKEAEVSFRTDEVQTRELLESSAAGLKDLMSREGMVLTGMTVGANGSGNSNPNGKGSGKQQQVFKPVIGSVAPVVRADSGLRPLGSIGKSLDLFV